MSKRVVDRKRTKGNPRHRFTLNSRAFSTSTFLSQWILSKMAARAELLPAGRPVNKRLSSDARKNQIHQAPELQQQQPNNPDWSLLFSLFLSFTLVAVFSFLFLVRLKLFLYSTYTASSFLSAIYHDPE